MPTSYESVIENLYDTAKSAVLFNGNTGEYFRTTEESDKGGNYY